MKRKKWLLLLIPLFLIFLVGFSFNRISPKADPLAESVEIKTEKNLESVKQAVPTAVPQIVEPVQEAVEVVPETTAPYVDQNSDYYCPKEDCPYYETGECPGYGAGYESGDCPGNSYGYCREGGCGRGRCRNQ